MSYHKKVIFSSLSRRWRFFDWVAPDGSNPIQEWYEGESFAVQQQFDAILKMASKQANHLNWVCFKRFLEGKHFAEERIWELQFKEDGKQYRILGRFDGEKQAILFCGCSHKGSVYTPPNALETALKRAKALSQGKADRHERTIEEDF